MLVHTDTHVELEELFNKDAVCTSRAPHQCSIVATWSCGTRPVCPSSPKLWCDSRYKLYLKGNKIEPDRQCMDCNRPVSYCWVLRPL